MAASDPTWGVPTPTGTLQGAATFSWDGGAFQPSASAGPNVSTPTGVLRGVAPFAWGGGGWQPSGLAGPGVPTPSGTLDGIALFTWNGTAWVPTGGAPGCATPTGTLRGVAGFFWDGTAWQPSGQAGPSVATPSGVLTGMAMFSWDGTSWTVGAPPALDLSFMVPGTLDPRITFTRASTATYTDITGAIQTATANTPRWDYDPVTHVLRGLLIEEARTNSVLNSATLVTQSVTVTAVPWTLSFYGTGTVTLSGTSTAGPLTGTSASNRVSLTFTPTAGTLTLTVTGTVQNAQLEAGAFATSYIPTTVATVTRATESATMATSPWFTNPLALSCAVDAMLFGVNTPGSVYFQFDDGTQPNRINILTTPAGTDITYNEVAAGSLTTSQGSPYTIGIPFKAAMASVAGLHLSAVNGVIPAINTRATAPPPVTTLRFGKAVTATVGALYLRRVRYWPRVLSNAELQSVTT